MTNYLLAQPEEQLSDLTLANIEAMGYDTIQEAAIAGCKGCVGSYDSCYAQITDIATGDLVLSVECPGFYSN